MKHTAPDTNVVIFRFLGGKSGKISAAENYFDKVSDGSFEGILFPEVEEEYREVVKKEVSKLRDFVEEAIDRGSWSKADSSLTVDTDFSDNFLESLKQRCGSVYDGHKKLNKMKRSMVSSFRRHKKRYLKVMDNLEFEENVIDEVKSNIPDKDSKRNEEKENDAKIVVSAFHFSNFNSKNLYIISDDSHLTELNYNEIESLLDYSNYNKYVACTPLGKFK